MKRLLAALTLILALCVPAHALSDEEYIRLKRSPAFAEADRSLASAYNDAKDAMSYSAFEELRESQREWIDYGRDQEASRLMRQDYSRVEAYTEVTRRRTAYIRQQISEYSARTPRNRPSTPRPAEPRRNPNRPDFDIFTGQFSKDDDVYMSVQWVNKSSRLMGVRLRCGDEEWFGKGRLHERELTAEAGSKSVTLYFVNANAIRIETNEAFNRAMDFNAEGRYTRLYSR
ncbi:MAG: DUF1311 domain-containing protein [Synergistaceae bacterium]|nr:DUF1311 domain-containing protein [Synergistaceae bacterium]